MIRGDKNVENLIEEKDNIGEVDGINVMKY